MQTILIVDDEYALANVLSFALEDEGYRVFMAANGKLALEKLAENKPDLVIADFMMPILDGPAMARAMKSNPDTADIPIIMMSAVAESSVRERFDGYVHFLRKPFRIPMFLDAVQRVLSAHSD